MVIRGCWDKIILTGTKFFRRRCRWWILGLKLKHLLKPISKKEIGVTVVTTPAKDPLSSVIQGSKVKYLLIQMVTFKYWMTQAPQIFKCTIIMRWDHLLRKQGLQERMSSYMRVKILRAEVSNIIGEMLLRLSRKAPGMEIEGLPRKINRFITIETVTGLQICNITMRSTII